MKKLLTLFLFGLVVSFSFGQTNYQDVIYLKNGSIIRGMITEQIPNKTIKIETADNSLFVYQMNEIKKITKEPKQTTKKSTTNSNPNITDMDSYWSLHFGTSIPVGNFSDKDEGGAAVGINVGVKYLYPLNNKGLGLYAGADINYNDLKNDVKDDLKDNYDVDVKFSKYINIPITAGLNYAYKANEDVAIFGTFGVGLDFLKVTDRTIKYSGEKLVTSFDLSTQLAYKIGGGIVIKDKYIISLYYNGLGNHSLKGEHKYNGNTEDFDADDLKIQSVSLTFGFRL